MIPRPDEQASEEYKHRDKKFRNSLKSGLSAIGSIGVGAVSGLGAKVLPFINEYIPSDLAVKGISKVAPKIGDFLRTGQSMGLDIEKGLQFVKDNIVKREEKSPKNQKNTQKHRNIIEQYSPELHDFIVKEVQGGRSPLEAGAIATISKKGERGFKDVIDKIVKDHKAPWSAILQTVYGDQGQVTKPQSDNQQQPNNQAGQGGAGQQALMDILNKINQRLG